MKVGDRGPSSIFRLSLLTVVCGAFQNHTMSGKSLQKARDNQLVQQWTLDLMGKRFQEKLPDLQGPTELGYKTTVISENQSSQENKPDIIVKKSWEIALAPMKQLPMNVFIMYMAGNSISIFPIMMVGMLFIRPIQALLSISQTYKMIEGRNAPLQKIVYFLGNLCGIMLAMYKCHTMGLLPTHSSDWLAFVDPQKRIEWTSGGFLF